MLFFSLACILRVGQVLAAPLSSDRDCEVDSSAAKTLQQRNAITSEQLLWPNGIVYYQIEPELDFLLETIEGVMRDYEKVTCIRFQRRREEKNYVKIHIGNGCSSFVGRFPFGHQPLSLGLGCHKIGTITHELGHSLGFHHEHNRSDRDEYLEIIWDNVKPGYEKQFEKLLPSENLLLNNFDYESIMLYGSNSFSKDHTSTTINPKKEGIRYLKKVAEKDGLSKSDIQRINMLYGCKKSV